MRINYKHSEETKRKIGEANSVALKGNKIWLGRKHSEETKKKISENRKGKLLGNTYGFKKGLIPWNKGKPYLAIKGEKNHRWKGGISKEVEKIRSSLEYKLWQDSVKNRDGNKCQKCGESRTYYLMAHHILNFAKYHDLRFAIDNGITFCRPCHKEFHLKYGFETNNREQLEEFLSITLT